MKKKVAKKNKTRLTKAEISEIEKALSQNLKSKLFNTHELYELLDRAFVICANVFHLYQPETSKEALYTLKARKEFIEDSLRVMSDIGVLYGWDKKDARR